MDTIQTIHSLLLCNGSARPVMVALTPSEKARIAEAPAMAEALEAAIVCGMVPISSAADGGAAKYSQQVVVADQIRAILARIKGETP